MTEETDGIERILGIGEEFKNREIECIDCHIRFTFSAGEQFFYYSKRLAEPKRCKPCREARKRTIARQGGE